MVNLDINNPSGCLDIVILPDEDILEDAETFEVIFDLVPELDFPVFLSRNSTLVTITSELPIRPTPPVTVTVPGTVEVSRGIPAVICFDATFPSPLQGSVLLNLVAQDGSASKYIYIFNG